MFVFHLKLINTVINLVTSIVVFFIIKVSAISFLGLHDREVYVLVLSIIGIISLLNFYVINLTQFAELGLYMAIVKSLIILFITVVVGISVLVSEGTEIISVFSIGIQKVVWDSNRLEDLLNIFSNRQRINIPAEVREVILGKAKCPEDIKKYMLEYKLAQQDTYYNKYLKDMLKLVGIRQQPTLTEWVTLIGVFYTCGKFVFSLYKLFYTNDKMNSELNVVGNLLNNNNRVANIANREMGQGVVNLGNLKSLVESNQDHLNVLGGELFRGLIGIMLRVVVDESDGCRKVCFEKLRGLDKKLDSLFPGAVVDIGSNKKDDHFPGVGRVLGGRSCSDIADDEN